MPNRQTVDDFARALDGVAAATGCVSLFETQLTSLLAKDDVISQIGRFTADPAVSQEGKRSALAAIFQDELNAVLLGFMLLLVDAEVFTLFPDIAREFLSRLSLSRSKVDGEIISAYRMSDENIKAVETEVGRILNLDVSMRLTVDPELTCGSMIKVGDFVLDATAEHELETMKKALLS